MRSPADIWNAIVDLATNRLNVNVASSDVAMTTTQAGTPTVYNIVMTTANTEYSQALPANTKRFTFQCQTAFDVRFAFVAGKVATPTAPYMTLKSGAAYYEDTVDLTSKTLYVACGTAGKVLELTCWS
jgi:hypothetical protein